jgi:hypothetical protein
MFRLSLSFLVFETWVISASVMGRVWTSEVDGDLQLLESFSATEEKSRWVRAVA